MSLAGRVALVTGASQGRGRSYALAPAAESLRVAVGFRGDKDGVLAAPASWPGAVAIRVDVASTQSVVEAQDAIEVSLGPVEVPVNNAGLRQDRILMGMGAENWAHVLEASPPGVLRGTKRALLRMLMGTAAVPWPGVHRPCRSRPRGVPPGAEPEHKQRTGISSCR